MASTSSAAVGHEEHTELNIFQIVVKLYQKDIPDVPKGFLGKNLIGEDGIATRMFLVLYFCNNERGIQFVQDTGLHAKEMRFSKCNKQEAGVDNIVGTAERKEQRADVSSHAALDLRCGLATAN